jgi:hypothetical protein
LSLHKVLLPHILPIHDQAVKSNKGWNLKKHLSGSLLEEGNPHTACDVSITSQSMTVSPRLTGVV